MKSNNFNMPELLECYFVGQCLNRHWSNKNLNSIEWNDKSKYRISGIPNYNNLISYLPRKILRVWSRGKVIVIELYDNIYITSQLAMEGKWSRELLDHSGVIFNFDNNEKWYYDDSRHMGNIDTYMNLNDLKTIKFKNHGPDFLITVFQKLKLIDTSSLHECQIPITIEEWKKHIINKRIANKRISDYLKDQKRFSGIGNYMRAEILYTAKIRPNRPLCELSDYEIDSLYYITLDIVLAIYCHHGLTIKSYWDPEGHKGTYPVKIYGKSHDPFGNPVIKSRFTSSKSEQMIHWVPNIQI